MHYSYDASGNRITKKLSATKEDYYVRDAQGNVLALYAYDNGSFTWAEQHIYGSSRLGIVTPGFTIQSGTPLANDAYNSTGDVVANGIEGKRIYELTNHLGNVLVTISDIKTGVDEDSDTVIDYYIADVLTAQDYYAFGMIMPGRTYRKPGASYKYGFNGKENDDEVKGEGNQQDYGMRIYDPRLGRFLSVDPITKQYPELTPYQFASNRPIDGIDLDGLEWSSSGKYHNYLTGKWEVKHEVVLSLNNAKNVLRQSNATEKHRLEEIAKATEKIYNEQAYSGTYSDPVVKLSIKFTDEDTDFKVAFSEQTFVTNFNTITGKGTADVAYNGATENIGDILNNKVEIGISQLFLMTNDGKNILGARTLIVKTLEEIARTFAHELGHTLGLRHPFDDKADEGDVRNNDGPGPVIRPAEIIPKNLMNSGGNLDFPSNSGKALEQKQREKIDKKLSTAPKTE